MEDESLTQGHAGRWVRLIRRTEPADRASVVGGGAAGTGRGVRYGRRLAAWFLGAAMAAAALVSVPTGAAANEIPVRWNVLCGIDHYGADDPIVSPGQPGNAHMHSFFGSRVTDAFTTAETLMASPSTCGRDMGGSDRSAYWIPSLMKKGPDGTPERVTSATPGDQSVVVYYRRAGGPTGPKVRPIPIGLKIIAGDATARSAQPLSVVAWDCARGGPQTPHIPTCSDPNQPIHVNIVFPSCWDGVRLDSPDHKSHMAYPAADGGCPSTHPVSLPQVTIEADWDGITGGPDYSLASGGVYSMHADFFAAWDPRVQNALVESCLNTPRECGGIHRNGNTLFRPDYDPDPVTIDLNRFSASPASRDTPWPTGQATAPASQGRSTMTPPASSPPTAATTASAPAPTGSAAPADTGPAPTASQSQAPTVAAPPAQADRGRGYSRWEAFKSWCRRTFRR